MPDPEIHSLEEFARQRRALYDAAARGPQYDVEAYMLVCDAVGHTCRRLQKRRHISGPELLDGLVDLAHERFGYLADLVLENWGVTRTDDVGQIVFHLVEVGLLSKRDDDSQDDFHNVFDLRHTLRERHTIALEDEGERQEED